MPIDDLSLLPDMLPRLWTFAMRITSSSVAAEALVCQACQRALEDAAEAQSVEFSIVTMYSIMLSIWKEDFVFRSGVDIALSSEDLLLVDEVGAVDSTCPHQELIGAVNSLPNDHREVILLMEVERFTDQETSAILKVPVVTVRNRLYRARHQLGTRHGERYRKVEPISAEQSRPIQAKSSHCKLL